jgi:hypothetical protein
VWTWNTCTANYVIIYMYLKHQYVVISSLLQLYTLGLLLYNSTTLLVLYFCTLAARDPLEQSTGELIYTVVERFSFPTRVGHRFHFHFLIFIFHFHFLFIFSSTHQVDPVEDTRILSRIFHISFQYLRVTFVFCALQTARVPNSSVDCETALYTSTVPFHCSSTQTCRPPPQ